VVGDDEAGMAYSAFLEAYPKASSASFAHGTHCLEAVSTGRDGELEATV